MVDFGESFGKNIGNIQYALDKLPTGHYNEVTEWLLWRDDMARDTKNRIIETALALFSQSGYLATSMNDIAQQVGLTKAALYKHFSGKQEILDCIVAQMERMDLERAQEYEMPETEPDGFAEAYQHIPVEQIYAYSLAQFRHWTEEEFPARFRRMLTLEQYRDPEMGRLYRDYLAGGPVEYMAAIFGGWRTRTHRQCSSRCGFMDRCFCCTACMMRARIGKRSSRRSIRTFERLSSSLKRRNADGNERGEQSGSNRLHDAYRKCGAVCGNACKGDRSRGVFTR